MARILHLDDVEMIHDVVRRILESYGHELVWAPDGDAALLRIQSDWQSIDLILTDVYHPGASAAEVAQIGLARAPSVPVIISSDAMTLDSVRSHFQDDRVHYLSKPFLPQDLIDVVERALEPIRKG